MLFFETGNTDPTYNLAFEQHLFDTLPTGKSALGLWQNARAVIIGRHQNTTEEIDADAVRDLGIAVVRRMSGGGAVYHDLGNLNFTYITDQPVNYRLDFAFFTTPVIEALAALGITASLSGRNDLCIGTAKFSGNAQYSHGGRVLHHGTLLFDADLSMLPRVLRVPPEKLAGKGVASVASRVTNIVPHLVTGMSMADFQRHVRGYLSRSQELTPYVPTAGDLEAIDALRASRYDTFDWNWGASPRYNTRRSIRFAGGGITAYLQVEQNILRDVALHGDFFALGDVSPLTKALSGHPRTREGLTAALRPLGDPAQYIYGLDTESLLSLLLENP